MEEQRNRKPAEPIHRGWRIGRQQLVGLWLLTIPLVAILAALVWPLVFPRPIPSKFMICLSQLKQIGIALRLYAEDNDDTLPPAGSWQEARAEYVRDGEVFTCPTTGKPYLFNDNLAGKTLPKIANQDQVALAWEARADDGSSPHHGGFNVVFLDGHSKWLDEATFSQLMTRER